MDSVYLYYNPEMIKKYLNEAKIEYLEFKAVNREIFRFVEYNLNIDEVM